MQAQLSDIEALIERVKEVRLRDLLKQGIGYLHEGMHPADQDILHTLFQSGAIQVQSLSCKCSKRQLVCIEWMHKKLRHVIHNSWGYCIPLLARSYTADGCCYAPWTINMTLSVVFFLSVCAICCACVCVKAASYATLSEGRLSLTCGFLKVWSGLAA